MSFQLVRTFWHGRTTPATGRGAKLVSKPRIYGPILMACPLCGGDLREAIHGCGRVVSEPDADGYVLRDTMPPHLKSLKCSQCEVSFFAPRNLERGGVRPQEPSGK